jgi:hypothetical protein
MTNNPFRTIRKSKMIISSMGRIKGLEMKGAELKPEQAAGPDPDQGAEDSAAEGVQGIVNTDIDLGVRYKECPGKNQPPPSAGMPEGEEQEEGQGKMVTSVGGGEAGAGGAILRESPHTVREQGVLTGAEAEDQVFHPAAARQVADNGRHDQGQGPIPAFFWKVQCDKDQEKKVEGDPKFRLPEKEEKGVQPGAGPILVNPGEQPVINRKDLLKKPRMNAAIE